LLLLRLQLPVGCLPAFLPSCVVRWVAVRWVAVRCVAVRCVVGFAPFLTTMTSSERTVRRQRRRRIPQTATVPGSGHDGEAAGQTTRWGNGEDTAADGEAVAGAGERLCWAPPGVGHGR